MLRQLAISHFILIEASLLEFGPGLSVFTGETGAGKSMVVEALKWVLGGRNSADVAATAARVTQPRQSTSVEAVFEWSPASRFHDTLARLLEENGIPSAAEGRLMIKRELSGSGKGRASANGVAVSPQVLSALGTYLVDMTNQDGHQILLKSSAQRDFLDESSAALPAVKADHRDRWQAYKDAETALHQAQAEQERLKRDEDYIQYQLSQIADLELNPDEEARLLERKHALKSVQVWQELGKRGAALLGEAPFLAELSRFAGSLEAVADENQVLRDEARLAKEAVTSLKEVYHGLTRHLSRIDADGDDIDAIESKLSTLKHLQRKYKMTIEDLAGQRQMWQTQMAWLAEAPRLLAGLTKRRDEAKARVIETAARLFELRSEAATHFKERVRTVLSNVGMPKVQFDIELIHHPETAWSQWNETGADSIQFLLSANPGQPLRPLSKVASGGELSRTLLAIKSASRLEESNQLYLFDEIDTGIGGPTGDLVGNAIWEMSQRCQVFCITHLPQVAHYADTHFVIEKREVNAKTASSIRALTHEERSSELARMLGGEGFSEKTQELARDILKRGKTKSPLSGKEMRSGV